MKSSKRLNQNLVWVFALVAAGAALAGFYAMLLQGPKVVLPIAYGVFGAAAGASAFLTDVSKGKAIAVFVAPSLLYGILAFVLSGSLSAKVGSAVAGDLGGTVGSAVGGMMGILYLVVGTLGCFLSSLIAVFAGREFQKKLGGDVAAARQ
jgi:hypothetical protein